MISIKRAFSVLLVISLLSSCIYAIAEGSIIDEMIDDMSYDEIVYLKQKIDSKYDTLKRQKEKEDNSVLIDWVKMYYVDSFGDPTDQAYIRNAGFIQGQFSNSATNNDLLYVKFLISEDAEIMLYEYGKYQVKKYSTEGYNILIKDELGETTALYGKIDNDRLTFNTEKFDKTFIDMLCKPQILKIHISSQSNNNTSYSFVVNTTGFEKVYRESFPIAE